MAQEYQMLIPVQGVQRPILPEVSLRGKNLFEKERSLYEDTQFSGLIDLSSPEINRVARTVQPENPTRQFINYAKKHSNLSEQDIKQAYTQLHEQLWQKYWIRAREILVWLPSQVTHPRIISEDSASEVTSVYIRDYKITRDEKFDIRGIKPDPRVRVNWLRQDGNITKEMAKLLGASNDTYVRTDPNPEIRERLRALDWYFGLRGVPFLLSDWYPWDRDSYMGSLLGRKQ